MQVCLWTSVPSSFWLVLCFSPTYLGSLCNGFCRPAMFRHKLQRCCEDSVLQLLLALIVLWLLAALASVTMRRYWYSEGNVTITCQQHGLYRSLSATSVCENALRSAHSMYFSSLPVKSFPSILEKGIFNEPLSLEEEREIRKAQSSWLPGDQPASNIPLLKKTSKNHLTLQI